MVFYEISGDIEVSIYGACDKKIGGELKSAIKKAVYEVASKNGSFEVDDIQVNIDNLEYEKEEE